MSEPFLFSSESVTEGHPDKIADQISDAVLDAVLSEDPTGRVACETLVATGLVVIAGQITTRAALDYQQIARTISESWVSSTCPVPRGSTSTETGSATPMA